MASHEANVSGFINMIEFAKTIDCKKFVYASSSAVYGDDETLPKTESSIGEPLSPYAATKRINEVYASTYFQTYGLASAGLRYFNVFGKRQDPQGAYAAVIPKWIDLLKSGKQVTIFGNGTNTTRDYCHVSDIVQANIKAALCESKDSLILNIGTGDKTDLNTLAKTIITQMNVLGLNVNSEIRYEKMRAGDIVHSVAKISKASESIQYKPEVSLEEGLKETITFFANL
jgi:UDP-N-acetylglucosamine 4-epimerase